MQHQLNDNIVDHAAQHRCQQAQSKVFEQLAKDHIANDHGRQADNDSAAAHVNIRKALILGQQTAGQCHNAVGEHQSQHLVEPGVDAVGAGHGLVAPGGAHAGAQFCAEEPVQQPNDHQRKSTADENGFGNIPQGYQDPVFINIQRHIGTTAHNPQVYGIQRQLGQNTCQDRRYAKLGMQNTGNQSGNTPGQERQQHGQPNVHPCNGTHHQHGAAGAKAAVHRQIGQIKNLKGQIHAHCHDTPDDTLGTSTGQRS